jgi:hypothetical protein
MTDPVVTEFSGGLDPPPDPPPHPARTKLANVASAAPLNARKSDESLLRIRVVFKVQSAFQVTLEL